MNSIPSMMKVRTPPHNADAEYQLLGAILVNNETFYLVSDFLKPEHFYVPANRTIFESVGALIQDGKTVSPITLKTYFPADEKIGDLTVTQYLLRITKNAASLINVEAYGRQIADLSLRRDLIALSDAMRDSAHEAEIDVSAVRIIDDIGTRLFDIRPIETMRDDGLEGVSERVTAKIEQTMAGNAPPVPVTGLPELDEDLGGLQPGNLILLAGRPGMGKTVGGVHVARRVARQGFGVVVFTLEVSEDQWFARLVTAEAATGHQDLYYKDVIRGRLTDQEFEAYRHFSAAARRLPIEIDDTSGLTIAQIEARSRVAKAKFERAGTRLGAIVIDYIGLMSAGDRYKGNKTNEVGEISVASKGMAKRLDTCVLALSQLNRGVEGRENKRPQLSDLRDSGNLEQDADVVMFLYRPAYYDQKDPRWINDQEFMSIAEPRQHDLDWIVAKNRNGPTNTRTAYCEIGKSYVAPRSFRTGENQ